MSSSSTRRRASAGSDPTVSIASTLVGGEAASRRLRWWWIALRWSVVYAMFGAVYIATEVSALVPPPTAARLWLLGIGLAAFDGLLVVAGPTRVLSPRWLGVQVAVDAAALAAVVHLTGGMANPFATLFVANAMIAALMLPARAATWAAAGIAALVGVLTLVESTGLAPPGCLLEQGVCEIADGSALAAWGFTTATLCLACTFVVGRLVDEARRSQREAEAEQIKLRSIVGGIADAVLVASPDGDIILHNQAALRLWPVAPATPDLHVCHGAERWQQLLEKLRAPEASEDHPLFEVGGAWWDASYARVCDPAGELLGVVMVARDVTEMVKEQDARCERERLAVTGRLAAALAHELNNPLCTISLFTEHALKASEGDPALARQLRTVKRNADLCGRIVKDLLVHARRRPPSRTTVDAGDLLGDVTRTLELQSRRSGVVLELDVAPGTAIWGDPDQLRQVLVNLGLNAIDAMPGGGALAFRAARDRGEVRIDVADQGVGIPPEQQARVFEAFFTTKPDGTGLGLAVVNDVIVAHHGRIAIDSAVGRGTTFSVHLPAAAGGGP